MRFSLVLGTIARTAELRRFLSSLAIQTHQDIQLIVIDQNEDDRVARLLDEHRLPMEVVHLHSRPGLSRARNVGLSHVGGDVVGFPDDDCWYGPRLIETLNDVLTRNRDFDGLTGRSVDADGRASRGVFSKKPGPVRLHDVWAKGISYTIFLRRQVCEKVGKFDETLGVGARTPFSSGEETDYLIRALQHGASLAYRPDITVFHPDDMRHPDQATIEKAYRYGAGMGRVLVKHNYPLAFRIRSIARPFIGSVLAACQLNLPVSRMRRSTAFGRLSGMRNRTAFSLPDG